MNKHTQGPWFYRKGDEWSHSVVTKHGALPDGEPNCWTVATLNKQREPEHIANAHLIAAAPELLEALKDAYPYIGNNHLRARIGAVITKAEGDQQ